MNEKNEKIKEISYKKFKLNVFINIIKKMKSNF